MDWVSAWDPGPYIELEPVDAAVGAVDPGRLTAWLIVTAVALALAAVWYRQRVSRHSFCCATVGRDVEVLLRLGRVLSCSAFEDPTAIACPRRCLDRTFRAQWGPALPGMTRPRAAEEGV